MALVRSSLGAFIVLGFAAAACSSSSPAPTKAAPGGDDASAMNPAPDAGNPFGIDAKCGLLSMIGGGTPGTCPSGQTCCTTLAVPPSASCVAVGQCTGISNECSMPSDCTGGKVCCAGAADGGTMPAGDAAAGPGGMMVDPSAFSTACQASCTSTQMQYCTQT